MLGSDESFGAAGFEVETGAGIEACGGVPTGAPDEGIGHLSAVAIGEGCNASGIEGLAFKGCRSMGIEVVGTGDFCIGGVEGFGALGVGTGEIFAFKGVAAAVVGTDGFAA